LSQEERAVLRFAPLGDDFSVRITRTDFEDWIAEDLARIERALGDTLDASGLGAGDIDQVFLTGGTSFVPAVRALFARRFGAAKINSGDELVSIATGLALIGAREDYAQWAA